MELTHPPGDPARRGFPVLVFNPKTGQVLQRLNFAPAGPVLAGRAEPHPAFAWAPTVEVQRRSAEAPVVLLTDGGMVVSVAGRAWGLRGARAGR